MKTARTQVEDQRKQLYTTQINLATEKAAVLDLKTELQKTQEALAMAKEAAKAAEATPYELGVVEIEARLTPEEYGGSSFSLDILESSFFPLCLWGVSAWWKLCEELL